MTTVVVAQLVAPAKLTATDAAAIYTAPALTTVKIGSAVFTNTSANPVTITAGITTGAALIAAQTMISAMVLAPGQAYISPELAGAVLPATSALRAYASVGGAVTFTASGLTIK